MQIDVSFLPALAATFLLIFARTGTGWQAAGPTVPAALTGGPVQVIRLTRTSTGDVAVLQAGSSLIAAWRRADGSWTESAVLPIAGGDPSSVSFDNENSVAVVTAGGRAQTVSGPGRAWRTLPALPPGRSVVLALPAGSRPEALAATGGTMTVWQLSGARWSQVQTIKVPIQYGSSSGA